MPSASLKPEDSVKVLPAMVYLPIRPPAGSLNQSVPSGRPVTNCVAFASGDPGAKIVI